MNIDLKIGDIILGGRFKNHRMEAKDFGTDELGQPTVNGRKLLTVRIEKAMPIDQQSRKTREKLMKKEAVLKELSRAVGRMKKTAGSPSDAYYCPKCDYTNNSGGICPKCGAKMVKR